jgi:uncharacterized protein (DUF305 family)
MRQFFLVLALVLASFVVAHAQTSPPQAPTPHAMPGMSMSGGQGGTGEGGPAGGNDADRALMVGMKKMQSDMEAAPATGNPDKDFVSMMIPHHQGAVAMARIELQYGKDPAMRRLAETIIRAQDSEIATMKTWQAKHPK